jgi:hypothetical protein
VKHLAHEVGIAPHLLRRWLRRKYGRHYKGNWQWRFSEDEVRAIASLFREERR